MVKKVLMCIVCFTILNHLDDDECDNIISPPCAQSEMCVNQPGSFVCRCPAGSEKMNNVCARKSPCHKFL